MRSEYYNFTNDEAIREKASAEARRFVEEETQFQLGHLPTEQPHPYTLNFSQEVKDNPSKGVALLIQVDGDLPPVARRIFLTQAYDNLVKAMVQAITTRKKICFSGCGSTGRLAMLLEEMWRQYWEDKAGVEPGAAEGSDSEDCNLEIANLVCSIMSGGDRALIRAVENFEDYQAFGARQVADLQLSEDDVLVAITEGGETSSVIGTAEEGLKRDCDVFFLFNNPASILCKSIERSKKVIEHPDITCLDLFSGSMALTGSTRMQATTLEMLVVGAAMEEAFLHAEGQQTTTGFRLQQANHFALLLSQLCSEKNLETMAELATKETEIYSQEGRTTYLASKYLLDIFSDTTERSPTFMLPPIAKFDDTEAAISWAMVKDPTRSSEAAWQSMLRHIPRGIDWKSEDYVAMDAPRVMMDEPPALGQKEISCYGIGKENDSTRTSCDPYWFLHICVDEVEPLISNNRDILLIGGTHDEDQSVSYHLPLDLPNSPIRLMHHLAIKLVANTISTASMGMMGRIRGNWMVQLDPTNKKLIDRGSRIIAQLTGLQYDEACMQLHLSQYAREAYRSIGGSTTTSPVVDALDRLGCLENA
ncbi:MAG: sugar phosphate isomerase [Gammaproteobacteria bacterium]|nr:sugar phosphate isomerase [Gammaproteobacteria bacterium]